MRAACAQGDLGDAVLCFNSRCPVRIWCANKKANSSVLTLCEVCVCRLSQRIFALLLLTKANAEVEETLKRIQSHKGVIGTIVVNAEGIPIRTTLDNSTTVQYAGLLHQLTMKARSTVRDIDPQNDLTFLRVRSKKHEIMVAPDKEYLLIVIQNPSE
ncbi:dynein light chain roadblock-type 2 isoform X1 [Lepisosteus oculatus]|uniref:dynein light chain roadblock-type 2 isoform X1 n=1 Tax=Lepisosteus oculatus TaxID=7918 RepID=UPI0035F509E6